MQETTPSSGVRLAVLKLTLTFTFFTAGISLRAADEPTSSGFAKVDQMFSKWSGTDTPGCAVGVIRDGQLVYNKGFGTASLEYDIPITGQTIFEIASFSKVFTSTCIALLMDQGKISPDDDIRKFIPEMHKFDPPVRVRHLLRCESGLFAQFHIMPIIGLENLPVQSPYTANDLLTLLTGQKKLPFEPGSEFRYGSGDFFLLGQIVQRVSGKSLAQFAQENVFQPLGMRHTFYEEEPSRIVKNRAIAHYKDKDGTWRHWRNAAFIPGGGGVNTSVEDLYRWDQNFYDNKLPKGKYIDELIKEGTLLGNRFCLDADAYVKKTNPDSKPPAGQYRGLKRLQFTGGFWGSSSGMACYPDQNFSVICLSNNSDEISPWKMAQQIAEIFLEEKMQPKPKPTGWQALDREKVVEVPEADLKDKAGDYQGIHGRVWHISLKDGKLWNTNFKSETYELKPLGQNYFLPTKYPTDTFLFERSGSDESFRLKVLWNGGSVVFEPVELADPKSLKLSEYVGEYHSDELSTIYRFIEKDDSLWLRINARGWVQLEPSVKDRFVTRNRHWHDTRVITFRRDDTNKVVGLTVSFWRVRGVDFEKR